jgi:transcription elongation factor S-II
MLDERELATRVKALSKAVSAGEPAPSVIALMNTLKQEANPTEEMLRVRPPLQSCLFTRALTPKT